MVKQPAIQSGCGVALRLSTATKGTVVEEDGVVARVRWELTRVTEVVFVRHLVVLVPVDGGATVAERPPAPSRKVLALPQIGTTTAKKSLCRVCLREGDSGRMLCATCYDRFSETRHACGRVERVIYRVTKQLRNVCTVPLSARMTSAEKTTTISADAAALLFAHLRPPHQVLATPDGDHLMFDFRTPKCIKVPTSALWASALSLAASDDPKEREFSL